VFALYGIIISGRTEKLIMTDEGTYINGKYLPSLIELERRRRIRLSVFAYAYEFANDSLISDEVYDRISRLIDKTRKTGNKKLDKFFATQFESDTGMWIRKHPCLDGIKHLYETVYKGKMN